MAPFKDKGSRKGKHFSEGATKCTHQGFLSFLNLWLEVDFSVSSGMQRRARNSNLSIPVENFSQSRNCFKGYGRVQEPEVQPKEISVSLEFEVSWPDHITLTWRTWSHLWETEHSYRWKKYKPNLQNNEAFTCHTTQIAFIQLANGSRTIYLQWWIKQAQEFLPFKDTKAQDIIDFCPSWVWNTYQYHQWITESAEN